MYVSSQCGQSLLLTHKSSLISLANVLRQVWLLALVSLRCRVNREAISAVLVLYDLEIILSETEKSLLVLKFSKSNEVL